MKYRCHLLFLFLFPLIAIAQKPKKPTLVVYGHDIEAFAAAIQSAKSGVPTLWIVDGEQIVPAVTEKEVSILENDHLDAGIWRMLLLASNPAMSPTDSTARSIRLRMNPQLMRNAVDRLIGQEANLSLQKGQQIVGLKNRGKRWEITLANKQKYEIPVILDLSHTDDLRQLALAQSSSSIEARSIEHASLAEQRLWMASGLASGEVRAISFSSFLSDHHDNYFNVGHLTFNLRAGAGNLPLRANIGQALGAIGGYCAFFKTSAEKIDIRKVQDELLQYGAKLVPYQDVAVDDRFATAIQKVGLTGIWQESLSSGKYLLNKRDSISFENVRPEFNQLYSRSQIWFLDNTGDYLTWKDAISLVKYVGQRGDELNKQIEQDWSRKLQFEGSFDLDRYISKYEFAVIVDKYCNPFVVRINAQGKIIR